MAGVKLKDAVSHHFQVYLLEIELAQSASYLINCPGEYFYWRQLNKTKRHEICQLNGDFIRFLFFLLLLLLPFLFHFLLFCCCCLVSPFTSSSALVVLTIGKLNSDWKMRILQTHSDLIRLINSRKQR